MEPKPENIQYYMSDITDIEHDFGFISTMLRWKDTRFFGPPPRGYYQAADFFSEYATQRIMVRQRQADVTIIGYAEFSYYPLIGALPADCWIHWLKQHFCLDDKYPLTWGDTMFFTRFIFFPKYNPTLLTRLLQEFFHREFKIRYVVILQMPDDENARPEDTPSYDMLEGLSTVLYPRNFSVQQCRNVQRLHIIHRNKVIESMRYRKALPEDNDDIVEVIDVDRPDLREEYGDFYIAEELQKEMDENDTHNIFIACELHHETVGFIWLNDDVNILTLVENFECEGFGNMIRFTPDKQYLEKRITVSGFEKKPYSRLFTTETLSEIYEQDLERLLVKSSEGTKKDYTCKRPTCPGIIAKLQMGLGDTDDKYFQLRAEFLRKMQLVETYLTNSDHYQIAFRKRLRIPYNIPDSHNPGDEMDYPFDMYSNVFAIKLLGINQTTDTRYASRFIATAFTAHPDRDYCMISIPSKIHVSRSVAMLLGFFVSLVPRPAAKIDDNVYIINRSTIFGHMAAISITPEDVPYVTQLLERSAAMLNKRASTYSVPSANSPRVMSPEIITESKLVNKVLADIFDNTMSDFHFLTIRCGDCMRPIESTTIVGFVIVRPFYRLYELEYKYNFIKSEISFKKEPGEIVLLRLHPNYMWESDAIFRHISCVTGYNEFYYLVPTMSCGKPLANDLVKQMQPIEPRQIAQIHRKDFVSPPTPTATEIEVNEGTSSFAIYYNNLLPSKMFGDIDPIIIIGFNSMTRALLRQLLFNFTRSSLRKGHCCLPRWRVTVISTIGVLEGAYDNEFLCDICENQEDCYINFENSNSFIRDTTRCMDFRKFFSFVSSNVEKIDRKEQTVVLSNGCELYYHTLIFSLSKRFGLPPAVHYAPLPVNYMHINHRIDKIKVYHKIEALKEDPNANDISIIVFGAHINAFEFINFLLTHNVPASYITLAMPWNPKAHQDVAKYNISNIDFNIEFILQEMVEDLGVTVIPQLTLKNYIYYSHEDIISHAVFERYPEETILTLPCDLFISYHLHDIGGEIQGLMTQAGIEMEKTSVLIDNKFRTSDPNIYAIGNFTQFRNTPNHQYTHVAKDEVASKLIHSLNLNEDEDIEYSVKYLKPVYFQAQLPMGYYMAKVVLPKRYIANHLDNNYSLSLVTYDGNFSRVRINEHGIVEEITCVTKTKRTFDHLQHFVGQHESLLNDLHSRWYLNEIPSFVDFFEEPWTELIMHPNYDDLRRRIRTHTLDAAKDIMNANPEMDRRLRKDLMKRYMINNQHTTDIEKTLLRFLRKHRQDFVYPFALPEDFHLNLAGKLNL